MLHTLTHAPIAASQRRAITLRAQAGDSDAYLALLRDVLPNLRAGVRRFGASMERDEAESVALLAFTEAVNAYDPVVDRDGVGVVALLSQCVIERLREAADVDRCIVSIPSRTVQRFWGIMRAADGDFGAALGLVTAHGMDERTFRDVYSVIFGTVSLTVASDYADTLDVGTSEVEDRLMAEHALSALDGDELTITRRANGFDTFRPESDATIADALGSSRTAVQRKRANALVTMREALGVG